MGTLGWHPTVEQRKHSSNAAKGNTHGFQVGDSQKRRDEANKRNASLVYREHVSKGVKSAWKNPETRQRIVNGMEANIPFSEWRRKNFGRLVRAAEREALALLSSQYKLLLPSNVACDAIGVTDNGTIHLIEFKLGKKYKKLTPNQVKMRDAVPTNYKVIEK